MPDITLTRDYSLSNVSQRGTLAARINLHFRISLGSVCLIILLLKKASQFRSSTMMPFHNTKQSVLALFKDGRCYICTKNHL